ncbi:MAG TPA: penicillin acylase family protein, partial [Acidobacteriaceae bacterium]|nr:penicillin acylase family protein [Acidobacteriaceae bacterium]
MPPFRPQSLQKLNSPVVRARWVLAAILILVGGVALFCWLGTAWLRRAMRTSLPRVDGTLQVATLSQSVTVQRDIHGVPHIRAANMDDLVVAQGYVTAQDRLWQLDMLRRFASGNLAEILGPRAVKHDRAQRIFEIGHVADAALAAMDAANQHYLQDYARGVNAYMAQTQDHLPAEFRLLHYRPAPWTPRDSVLVAMNLVQTLSMDFPTKLTRQKIEARLQSPTLIDDLYPVGSWRDHPPISTAPDITAPQVIPQIPL